MRVAVLDYGIGNLRSAQKALQRCGADALLTDDLGVIEGADAAVLPGVGNFGACMDQLERSGLAEAAVRFAETGKPFLGICVGMQLLYDSSEETPGRAGLGLIPGSVHELPAEVKRPQMQWNKLEVPESDPHPLVKGLDGSWMYFVHSYAAENNAGTIATVDYGGEVVAAVAIDNVWATQFHPEKSAEDGQRLLGNWLESISAKNRTETAVQS